MPVSPRRAARAPAPVREADPTATLGQAAMLAAFLALVGAAAWLGGRLTAVSVDTWYEALRKPAWTPPGDLIGAVWAILYVLMAVAAWLVWRKAGVSSRRGALALGLFLVQLALNVAWSGVFFGLREPGWAVAEIVILWVAVVATLAAFAAVSRWAAALLLPYLAWVTFAAYLNYAVWRLNAGA